MDIDALLRVSVEAAGGSGTCMRGLEGISGAMKIETEPYSFVSGMAVVRC
jgi:hypothetical protein